MKTLRNTQYEEFILKEVIRPFQGIIPVVLNGKRITGLCFETQFDENSTSFYYPNLRDMRYSAWWELTIDRLSRIYSEIDFSFFPMDDFSILLKHALKDKGVKEMNVFNGTYFLIKVKPKD